MASCVNVFIARFNFQSLVLGLEENCQTLLTLVGEGWKGSKRISNSNDYKLIRMTIKHGNVSTFHGNIQITKFKELFFELLCLVFVYMKFLSFDDLLI